MSLCIAVNTDDKKVIIAGDGRVLQGRNIVNNNHRKVRPLNNKAILYASGMQDIAEAVRKEILVAINENSSFEYICSVIKAICQKYHNSFKQYIVPDILETVVACVLAYYDKKPMFVAFVHNNDFEPIIYDKPNMAWLKGGCEQDKVFNYFLDLNNSNNKRNIEDLIYDTYLYANSDTSAIGGMVTIYSLDMNGIKILRKKEI